MIHNVLIGAGYVEDEVYGLTLLNYYSNGDKLSAASMAEALKDSLSEIYQSAYYKARGQKTCCNESPDNAKYCPTCGSKLEEMLDEFDLDDQLSLLVRDLVCGTPDQLASALPNRQDLWERLNNYDCWTFPGQLVSGPIIKLPSFDRWVVNPNFPMDAMEGEIEVKNFRNVPFY